MIKTNGKKILTFDKSTYSNLLTTTLPKIIETEEEYEETLSQVEQLTFTKEKNPEQIQLLKLLVLLVEDYENKTCAFEKPEHTRNIKAFNGIK